MFEQNYFKKNKVYTINNFYYLVMDGGLSINEDFEPIIVTKDYGKETIEYRPVDTNQFIDGTYNQVSYITLDQFIIKYGLNKKDFNNPFTRTAKLVRAVIKANVYENGCLPSTKLRISEKALYESQNSENYKIKIKK